MTLPPQGTPARESLQRDALRIGLAELERGASVADALYTVYDRCRTRLLEERGLMDEVPGRSSASCEALEDARILERDVCERWAKLILAGHGRHQGGVTR